MGNQLIGNRQVCHCLTIQFSLSQYPNINTNLAVFYLDKKLSVEKDDVLRGKIEVKRPREDVRSLREDDSQTCVFASTNFY